MAHLRRIVLAVALISTLGISAAPASLAEDGRGDISSAGTDGVLFIENVGQFDPEVRFRVWGGQGADWLTPTAQWLTLVEPADEEGLDSLGALSAEEDATRAAVNLRLSFVDANSDPDMQPLGAIETNVSYFIGDDPAAWQAGVPVYGGVRYVDLYPGLDLEVSAENGQVTRELVVKDEEGAAALDELRLRIEGADALALADGNVQAETILGTAVVPLLHVSVAEGAGLLAALDAEQEPQIEGDEIIAPFTWESAEEEVAAQDASDELVYATYLGGEDSDSAVDIEIGPDRTVYVFGGTSSSDFPAATGPGYDSVYHGSSDSYVAKLSNDGSSLLFATFLGGDDTEYGRALAVDEAGAAYVTGITYSLDFPILPEVEGERSEWGDPYIVKLAPDGLSLEYAVILGSSDGASAVDIAVDSEGSAYVTGDTESPDFPATNGPGYDTALGSDYADCYVIKLAPDGLSMEYGTFLGMTGIEEAATIAVDESGAAYVSGKTDSCKFPGGVVVDPYCGSLPIFVVKLAPDGLSVDYVRLFKSTHEDYRASPRGLAVDADGAVYLAGDTEYGNSPVTEGPGFDTTFNSTNEETDAFVIKLAPDGQTVEYATFLGGSTGSDYARDIIADASGAAYLIGNTASTDFPLVDGAGYSRENGGGTDAFVVALSPDGLTLSYASYLGGANSDAGGGIAADMAGNLYLAGRTYSADFPASTGPGYDTALAGSEDAFVVKLGGVAPKYYALSGQVNDGTGTGVGGVSIAANGVIAATTDSEGSYSFFSLPGSYTLTASREGYIFDPESIPVEVVDTDLDDLSFLATPVYTLSGRVRDGYGVGISQVEVTVGSTASTLTDAEGRYALSLPAGNYTLRASKAGYTFTPSSLPVRVVNADIDELSFWGMTGLSVSGTVQDQSGTGIKWVTIAVDGTDETTTDANGDYDLTLPAGSYTLTAHKTGYVFEPESLEIEVEDAELEDQSFIGTAIYSVSGTVQDQAGAGIKWVTIAVDGTDETTTDANGDYTLTLPAGSYSLTAHKTGYTFSPSSLSVDVLDADVGDLSFRGSLLEPRIYLPLMLRS